jgi:hypothetical protein
MTRRDAAWLIARAAVATGGPEFFSRWMQAAQTQQTDSQHRHVHSHAPPDPHDWNAYVPKFFSPEEFRILDAFTAILIPSDDTPGAREACVAAFTDFVVSAAAEYAPEMQARWRRAIEWLSNLNFGGMTLTAQLALMERMAEPEQNRSKQHPGYATYSLIKEMAVHAFYTSRVGLVDVLEYKGLAYLSDFPACNHPEHHEV